MKEWPQGQEIQKRPSYESESENSAGLEDDDLDKYGDNTGSTSAFIDNRPLKFGEAGLVLDSKMYPKLINLKPLLRRSIVGD